MERYERIKVIGQGAFGKVYLVRKKSDDSEVVIKQIPVDDLGKEERFAALNEVKVLAMLQHPNIIAHFDNFVAEKSLMIVMEYAPGGTLHDFIQERNSNLLDEDHILQFFVQLLVAIDHVHLQNILHRDLKTQNVMLNRKRNVLKIGDFGISKVLSTKITSAQTVVGTPCYISPEICEGKMYAKKSDMWALGCILYELTTLKKAFEGPNLPALVLKIMQASAVLVPIDKKYSIALKNLIYSLLQRNPKDRPDTHQVMATPLIVNAHLNLSTDIGRLPCTKINPETNAPITCTRMDCRGQLLQRSYLVEEYTSPGSTGTAKQSPKPVVYLWGGSVMVPMTVEPPVTSSDSKVASVTCGRTQRAGVMDDGKLIFWEVSAGSLGTTRFTMNPSAGRRVKKLEPLKLEPRLIGGLNTTLIKKVACGDMFTACLTDRGILMTFGNGANGSLGHGDYNDVAEPKLVHSMLEFETTEVACGSYHVIAITSEGDVYAWGKGDRGQLGLKSCDQHHTPQKVQLPASASVPVLACCGSDCSMIVTNSGQLLASGSNKHNKLTLDKKPSNDTASVTSSQGTSQTDSSNGSNPPKFTLLQRGLSNSLGLPSGTGFGAAQLKGSFHVTGHVTKPKWIVSEVTMFTLTESELVQQSNIITATMGINHMALLTASGEVITCGDNNCGQLGYRKAPPTSDNPFLLERKPQVVTALQHQEITKLACGDFFCIACSKDGSIYSWGRGRGGRLGKDTEENVFDPQKIPFEFHTHQVQELSCCHGVTLLLAVPQP